MSIRLVELAEIKRGSRVVDIAFGIGEPAITAAKKVGSGLNGHVLVTDISSQMLSIARQRASSLGLQDVIEFREGDAETIDLPLSAFDAALCRFGLMFLSNLKVGLINIYQLLLEGGHFTTAVWARKMKRTKFRLPFIPPGIMVITTGLHVRYGRPDPCFISHLIWLSYPISYINV